MRRIAVVTESIACLPPETVDRLGITVIPIPFEYAGRSYLDGVNISPGEFGRMLRKDLPPPVTSAPSPGVYKEVFCRLAGDGYDVLCVSPSAAVTRMGKAAEQGRDLARENGVESRIEVVDSGTAAMAQGFLSLEAARQAANSKGMSEILVRTFRLRDRVSLLVTLDTLDYLKQTSRVPGLGTLLDKVLQIKPIIRMSQGKARPLEIPRSRRRSKQRLLDLTEKHLKGDGPLHVAVQHTAAPEEAEELRDTVAERFGPEELLVAEFSPVMGSYAGPGLLGLAFYEDADEP